MAIVLQGVFAKVRNGSVHIESVLTLHTQQRNFLYNRWEYRRHYRHVPGKLRGILDHHSVLGRNVVNGSNCRRTVSYVPNVLADIACGYTNASGPDWASEFAPSWLQKPLSYIAGTSSAA